MSEYVLNISMGKDSVWSLIAMLYANRGCKKIGLDPIYKITKLRFADTTLEYPVMFEYAKKVEEFIRTEFGSDLKIDVIKPYKEFDSFFFGNFVKGKYEGEMRGFPFSCKKNNCWIRRDFKTRPLDRANRDASQVYVGIAIDEWDRTQRKMYDERFRFPLCEMNITEQECKDKLRELDLLNPLYDMGFTRLGCWLCPWQSKESLHATWKFFPDLWRQLRDMDDVCVRFQ